MSVCRNFVPYPTNFTRCTALPTHTTFLSSASVALRSLAQLPLLNIHKHTARFHNVFSFHNLLVALSLPSISHTITDSLHFNTTYPPIYFTQPTTPFRAPHTHPPHTTVHPNHAAYTYLFRWCVQSERTAWEGRSWTGLGGRDGQSHYTPTTIFLNGCLFYEEQHQ